MSATLLAVSAAAAASEHDKAFWRAIVTNGFAVPEGAAAGDLATELSALLGSPDPELRDEFGYTILATWIYQQRRLEPDVMRRLLAEWQERLRRPAAGETDAIFGRSFSALMLSVVAARDNAEAFLTEGEVRGLLAAGLDYLAAEHDVRGYDRQKGWMHSAAHTADLVKFVARSRWVTPADQRRILDGLTRKLKTTPSVFVFGEDERLARAALSVVDRQDFDLETFRAWTTENAPTFPQGGPPELPALHAFQNLKNFFAKLEVLLSIDETATSDGRAALDLVRAVLKRAY